MSQSQPSVAILGATGAVGMITDAHQAEKILADKSTISSHCLPGTRHA